MPANGLGTNSRSNSHDHTANVSSSSTSTSATPTTTTTSRRIDLDPKMQQQINAILGESSPTGFSSPSPGSLSPGAPPPRSSLSLSATPRHSRIAIIGSGISGIGAASKIVAAGHRVVIYEKGDHVGGHAHTELVDGIPVDIGFQVFNQVTYPNMVQWFTEHNVEMEVSDMSLAVSMNDGCLEWSSSGLNGLLAQRSNIANPSFLAMIRDLTRFQNDVETFLKEADTAPPSSPFFQLTMSDFLTSHHYSSYFQHYYILPVCAAIWSCPSRTCLSFPAYFIFTFMRNHHLLQLTNRPQWLTVKGRSQDGYIRKVCAPFWDSIRLNTEVVSVISTPSTPTAMGSSHVSSNTLTVVDASGHHEVFDHVILACHAPDTIRLLGKHITDDEHRILGAFHYQSNDVVLHHDTRLMPRSDRSWASWNFMGESTGSSQGVCVTYWINRLQNIPTKQGEAPILVTLNPIIEPDTKKIVKRFSMSHPVPSHAAVAAQKSLHEIQGKRNIWFAGAYAGWGFHEDGLVSGFKVAAGILHSSWQPLPYTPQFQLSLTQLAAQQIVHSFLRSFIKHGYLTLRQLGGSIETFGTKTADAFSAHVVIHNAAFYTKILLRADLGIPDAYIAGDITCHDMLSFLRLLLANRDDESNRSHGRMNYSQLITASMARTTSYLWHQWNKRNTPKQSRENIASHYDLGNDFFQLFLDPSMSYSCGIYRTPQDTLTQAQLNKWDTFITKARIRSTHRILEIGFGWGALSIMIAKRYGCRVTGITLSSQQLEYATKRVKEEKLSHLIDYHLIDYRLFQPGAHKFDRILSCEMLEAVGHEFYPDFYRHCDRMLTPDGLLVVQAITYPDSSYDEYRTSIDFIKESIFPGGLCPSLSALTEAMKKASTFMIEAVENIGPDYARTLADWRANFHANRHLIKALAPQYTDEFMRKWDYYFVYCQAGFASRALSTLQIVYTRPGNTRSLGN